MKFVPRFVVGLLLVILTACGDLPENEKRSQNSSELVKKKTINPALLAAAYEKKQKEEYEARLEAILNGYGSRVEELKIKAKKSATTGKENLQDIITGLEAKTAAVTSILDRLKHARLESWQDLKPEIHGALDDLELAYDKAASALKDGSAQQSFTDGPRTLQEVVPVSTTAEGN